MRKKSSENETSKRERAPLQWKMRPNDDRSEKEMETERAQKRMKCKRTSPPMKRKNELVFWARNSGIFVLSSWDSNTKKFHA